MNCTLKITSGAEGGQQFSCGSGETYIGRSQRCVVRLSSASVSYEHAVISRVANDYYIENLSANGTFINGERVNLKTRLRSRDQIRLGTEVTARVESLPSATRAGSPRKALVILVVMMMIAGVVVIAIDPFAEGNSADWTRAYNALQIFTHDLSNGRDLPRETDAMLREAWRLELARDRAAAAKAWVRLHILLSGVGDPYQVEYQASNHPRALARLLDSKSRTTLDDDGYKAALLQFLVQMERRK